MTSPGPFTLLLGEVHQLSSSRRLRFLGVVPDPFSALLALQEGAVTRYCLAPPGSVLPEPYGLTLTSLQGNSVVLGPTSRPEALLTFVHSPVLDEANRAFDSLDDWNLSASEDSLPGASLSGSPSVVDSFFSEHFSIFSEIGLADLEEQLDGLQSQALKQFKTMVLNDCCFCDILRGSLGQNSFSFSQMAELAETSNHVSALWEVGCLANVSALVDLLHSSPSTFATYKNDGYRRLLTSLQWYQASAWGKDSDLLLPLQELVSLLLAEPTAAQAFDALRQYLKVAAPEPPPFSSTDQPTPLDLLELENFTDLSDWDFQEPSPLRFPSGVLLSGPVKPGYTALTPSTTTQPVGYSWNLLFRDEVHAQFTLDVPFLEAHSCDLASCKTVPPLVLAVFAPRGGLVAATPLAHGTAPVSFWTPTGTMFKSFEQGSPFAYIELSPYDSGFFQVLVPPDNSAVVRFNKVMAGLTPAAAGTPVYAATWRRACLRLVQDSRLR